MSKLLGSMGWLVHPHHGELAGSMGWLVHPRHGELAAVNVAPGLNQSAPAESIRTPKWEGLGKSLSFYSCRRLA